MMFSALLPRRHRSLLYKVLLCIPVLWITVALIMYSDRGGGGGGTASGPSGGSGPSGVEDLSAVRSRGARRDLSEDVNSGPRGRLGLVAGSDILENEIEADDDSDEDDGEEVQQQESPRHQRPVKKATQAK